MGDRQNGGGVRRRRVHSGGTVPGPLGASEDADLEALFAAAIGLDDIDPEAEQRAVAAFRAARDEGALHARTRRRDDWRPREARRAKRSVKTMLSVFLASLTLGGVAVAAIGSVESSKDADDHDRPHPSAGTPDQPGADSSARASRSARPDHPDTAQDTEAHCRSYEQHESRGKVLDATAWRRLVQAAGGEQNVAAYCAEQLAAAEAKSGRGNSGAASGGSVGSDTGATSDGNGAANSGNDNAGADGGTRDDQKDRVEGKNP